MIDLSKKREEVEKQSSSSMPKILNPGVHTCTIGSITFKDGYNAGSLVVQLNLEGPDLSSQGFIGFARDKDNPAMGNYLGQVGRVDLTQWAFESKTIRGKNGDFEVDRDSSILREFHKLAVACSSNGTNKVDELMEGTVETIEDFIKKADKVLSGITLNFVIAGKEWINDQGYTQYNLFLPRVKGKVSYENVNASPSNLAEFDENTMIIKKNKPESVDVFESPESEFPF